MPDPVKAPPLEMVNELKFELSKELSEKFDNEPIPYEKERNIANDAINELAYYKALVKYNEIKIE